MARGDLLLESGVEPIAIMEEEPNELVAESNWSGGGGSERLLDLLEGKCFGDSLPEEYTLLLSGEEEEGGYSRAK